MSGQAHGDFQGDLIRPLGLVVLYCAYAEEELDELLTALSCVESFDDAKRQWTVGQKLQQAERLIHLLRCDDQLAALLAAVAVARVLFEKRNALIHGRLFAGGRLVSNRPGVAERRVTADELAAFAEAVFSCKEQLWLHRCRDLRPALADYLRGKRQ